MAGIVNGLPNEDSLRIGNNIRFLRENRKESREKLGEIIALSGSMIAKIEDGIRNISKSDLSSIAAHYQVSLATLKYDVITKEMLDKKDNLVDVQGLNDIVFSLVPLIDNSELGGSSHFENGIEELKYITKSDGTLLQHRFDNALSCFYKSFKEDGVIGGAQNSIFLILCGYGHFRNQDKVVVEKFMSGNITNTEMDIASDVIYEKISEEQKQYILKYDNMFNECLRAIKKDHNYRDLADLDLAAKYFLSFVDNDELPIKNQEFGLMLLYDLAEAFDNQYAKAAINKIFEFFGEETRV